MEKKNGTLLIFDCDGVLVDSEPLSNRIFVQCLKEEGYEIDEAYGMKHFLGISLKDCLVHLESAFNRKVPEGFVEKLSLLTTEEIKKALQPISGVKEALAALPQPKCVASGSDPERIELSLEVTGLRPYFQQITSSYEVPRGKPFPDVFLRAAEKMGYAPEACMVVEDTPIGMNAALAAGMQVFSYQPVAEHRFEVPEGVTVFSSMTQLPELINKN